MRNIFLSLLAAFLLIFSVEVEAQTPGELPGIGAPAKLGRYLGGFAVDSNFILPGRNAKRWFNYPGRMWFNRYTDSNVYAFDGVREFQLISEKDSARVAGWVAAGADGQTLSISNDSISISNGNTIVLPNYAYSSEIADSAAAVRSDLSDAIADSVALRELLSNKVTSFASPNSTTYPTTSAVNTLVGSYLLKSDTSAMLLPYLRTPDTTGATGKVLTKTPTGIDWGALSVVGSLRSSTGKILVSPTTGDVDINPDTTKNYNWIVPQTFTRINATALALDTTTTTTPTEGQIVWNSTDKTIEVPLSAQTTMQVGQEMYIRCVNKTGVTIPNGKAVYVNDAQGNRPTMTLAQANTTPTSMVIGVTTEDIAANAEGFVTTMGVVNGIDTRPFTTDGQSLYLSADSAGVITKTIPTSPNNVVFLGIALNTTTTGKIYVHPATPISADSTFAANGTIAPTNVAVSKFVRKIIADTSTVLRTYIGTAITAERTATATLTNKRIEYRTQTVASFTTSVAVNADLYDRIVDTAQSGSLLLALPTGTHFEGQELIFTITAATGTISITYNGVFVPSTQIPVLPAATLATTYRTIKLKFIWNNRTQKWFLVAKDTW